MTVQANGDEFQVNTTTENDQRYQSITTLADGSFLVTWLTPIGDGSGFHIYGQKYTASGAVTGSEFLVSEPSPFISIDPIARVQGYYSITALDEGGYAVAWNTLYTIAIEVFDASGALVSAALLDYNNAAETEYYPSIASLAGGGYVLAWQTSADDSFGAWDIHAQLFDASGDFVGSEIIVNTATVGDHANDRNARVAGLSDGGFVVTWVSDGNTHVLAQLYDASGSPIGTEFQVSSNPAGSQNFQAVAALSDGGFVVAFSGGGGGGINGLFARIFDGEGNAVGDDFLVSGTPLAGFYPSITELADGSFVISWMANAGNVGETSGDNIYARVFDADGTPISDAIMLNQTAAGEQITDFFSHAITGLTGGGFAAAWVSDGQDGSYGGIFARVFEIPSDPPVDGHQVTIDFDHIVGPGSYVSIDGNYSEDGFVLVPSADQPDFDNFTIYQPGTSLGQTSPVMGIGWSPRSATLVSESGQPFVLHSINADSHTLEAQSLTFVAHLVGGGTQEFTFNLDAVRGMQTLDFGGVLITALDLPTLVWPYELFDNIVVSQVPTEGDDIIYGDENANLIDGLGGNDQLFGLGNDDMLFGGADDDILDGGAGADDLDGGTGTDTASYADATAGVHANLGAPYVNSGDAAGDQYSSIENLTGSAYNDWLVGNGGVNVIRGGDGNDTVEAAGAGDSLYGEDGNDLLASFAYSSGPVLMDGGAGIDTATINRSLDAIAYTFALSNDVTLNDGTRLVDIERINFTSGSGNDIITGGSLDDVILGAGGDDQLSGGDGIDGLSGGDNDDVLDGGLGDDSLNGGAGSDTASYATASGAITVKLFAGTASGADGDDTLVSIENAVGSAYDDALVGDTGNNRLEGGAGNDFLVGGVGNDVIDGGTGELDYATFYFAPTTIGSYSIVAGTGADAGKLFVMLTDGAGSEAVVEITAAADGVITVKGIGSAAYLGTDTVTNVDRLLFSTVSADPFTIPTMPGFVVVDVRAGSNATGEHRSDIGLGTSGADVLSGSGAVDALYGFGDDDTLNGGAGADLLDGGTGSDTASYDGATVGVEAHLEAPYVNTGDAAGDQYISIENLRGSAFNDRLVGNFAAANSLWGGDGIDQLQAIGAGDSLYGEDGNDLLSSLPNSSAALMDGGAGVDTASINRSLDAIAYTFALSNDVTLNDGTRLIDIERINFTSGSGNDVITGGSLNDIILGSGGDDQLSGGDGNDDLRGGDNNDALDGGLGDDVLTGGSGGDQLNGGIGNDTADYSTSSAGVSINLQNGKVSGGDAAGDAIVSIENVTGSAWADNLVGNGLANALSGGTGNDVLNGGGGADTLYGGSGGDTFAFKTPGDIGSAASHDRIMDFEAGGATAATGVDLIDLSSIDANTKSANKDDAFLFIGSSAFSGKAGQLRYDQAGSNVMIYGDVNGDGVADFTLQLTIVGTFDSTDFLF